MILVGTIAWLGWPRTWKALLRGHLPTSCADADVLALVFLAERHADLTLPTPGSLRPCRRAEDVCVGLRTLWRRIAGVGELFLWGSRSWHVGLHGPSGLCHNRWVLLWWLESWWAPWPSNKTSFTVLDGRLDLAPGRCQPLAKVVWTILGRYSLSLSHLQPRV